MSQRNFFNERDDQMWADLVSPDRRALLAGGAAALGALGLSSGALAKTAPATLPANPAEKQIYPNTRPSIQPEA